VTLSGIGGIIGIGVGIGTIYILAGTLGWSMEPPLGAVVVAVCTSAAIGILFGFLPARRASRLDPIAALRHE